MSVSSQIDDLLSKAYNLALSEIEHKARKIMRENPRCKTYVLAMGSSTFYDKNGEPIGDYGPHPYPLYLKEIDDFVDQYDILKLTGAGIRIRGYNAELESAW